MDLKEAVENLTLKFTSANRHLITQATIKLDEWEVIKKALDEHSTILVWSHGKGYVPFEGDKSCQKMKKDVSTKKTSR